MNLEQIMVTYYAQPFALGQFSMAYDDKNMAYISSWNVPNVTQPTTEQVMALDTPDLEKQYSINNFMVLFLMAFNPFIDSVARQKNYNDAISCISYMNSKNAQWASEATTFSAWRDQVWDYLITQQAAIIAGSRPIPTVSQLLSELPVIVWPD